MNDVRIFARLADGTLHRAVHNVGLAAWEWVYASGDSIVGDLVLNFATAADLPKNAGGVS